jgi:hypothetical protein
VAINNLAGRYLQDSYKFVTQNSQSAVSPDIWDLADGEAVPITWINATASWAATATFALNAGGTPGPPSWSIQFNSASTFAGSNNFIYSGSALYYTGSFYVSGAISASFGPNTVGFFGTASWAVSSSQAISASYSVSASFATSASYSLSASFATTASYVTTLRAADPNKSIQFNSNGLLSGSSNFTFDSSSNKLVLSGSSDIVISGSDAGLQIFGVGGLRSILTGVPFLPSNIGSAWRQTQNVFVPSGSYGQIWSLITAQGSLPAIFIYNITSSNGDLQFKGSIGGSPGNGGKYKGYGIYASNLDKLLVGSASPSDLIYAFSASVINNEPNGFTASLGSAQELALISYSSSMRLNGGTGEGIQPDSFGYAWYPNPITYAPSASINYYTICGPVTSSNGRTLSPHTGINSPLSASIYALSASNQPISGAANLYPVGFLMSTFDSNTPSNELFVDLTPALTSSFNVPLSKIFNGSFVGNTLNATYAETICGAYNPDLNTIYIATRFASNEIGIVELNNNVTPPTIVSVVTSSGIYSNFESQLVYNSLNKDLIILNTFGPPSNPTTTYKIIDASTTSLTTTNFTTPKATISVLGYNSISSRTLPISNSFYGVSTVRGGSAPLITPASSSIYYAYKIESGSGGYVTSSQQIAVSYEDPQQGSYWLFEPTYASGSNINKIIAADRSNIGPIGNSSTYPENLTTTFARAGYVYAIDTASLTTSSFYTPYTLIDANGPNNLVEFRSKTGSLLSYVDPDGKFIGTASLANSYLTSSLSIYSGSATPILMTPSASSIWFKGSAVTASIVGTAVTISIDGGGGSSGPESDPIFVAKSASLATTGSNTFIGNQTITGWVSASAGFTGSLFGTASRAISALTASFVAVSTTNTNETHYLHFGNLASGVDNVEVDTNLTYNPGTNRLALGPGSTQSFADTSRFDMDSSCTMTLGKSNVLRVGDTADVNRGQVFISGSTNLYRSGSTILSVSGSFGSIMEVTDALKQNIFQVDSGSNTLLAVTTAAPGGVSLSGSIKLFGLTNPTKTNVLTYDTSTGEVFYTASSAVGGGGSATPGGANTTIQFNDSSVFSGSANYTFTKASNLVQLTGSFVVSGSTPMQVIGTSVVTGSLGVTGSILLNGSPISQPKAGSGSAASFSGTPLTSSISFGTAFSNNNYAVTVTGEDARSWTLQSKTSAGFTINSNSSVALTGPVYWIATPFNS